jgi:transcriptional regulator with XRE-family HTH domain
MKEAVKVISDALKEARLEKKLTQDEVGKLTFLSNKTLSHYETGRRSVTDEALSILTHKLDCSRLYIEAANEVTGGVFAVPWLDGENTDLHRASVKEKCVEELEEALAAINLIKVTSNPRFCNEEQKELVKESIEEVIDVYIAAAHFVAIMCQEYCFDVKQMFMDQRKKLKKNGYIK